MSEPPIGIVVAVRQELQAVSHKLTASSRIRANGVEFTAGTLGGKQVVIASSGMGAARARELTKAMISAFQPRYLIIGGFGAGLSNDVETGSIVVAQSVSCLDLLSQDPLVPTIRLSEPIKNSVRGALLTVPQVIQFAKEKHELHARLPEFLCADMESAGAAMAASEAKVDWIAIRAISDGIDDSMPLPFYRFVGDTGEVLYSRLIPAILARWWTIPAFMRLGANAARAGRNLTDAIESIVVNASTPLPR